jgi:hypothetical protein
MLGHNIMRKSVLPVAAQLDINNSLVSQGSLSPGTCARVTSTKWSVFAASLYLSRFFEAMPQGCHAR